jgi:hypothetical protein
MLFYAILVACFVLLFPAALTFPTRKIYPGSPEAPAGPFSTGSGKTLPLPCSSWGISGFPYTKISIANNPVLAGGQFFHLSVNIPESDLPQNSAKSKTELGTKTLLAPFNMYPVLMVSFWF